MPNMGGMGAGMNPMAGEGMGADDDDSDDEPIPPANIDDLDKKLSKEENK